jgi:aminoglycoside 6'-N-acetyltransferase I
MESLKDITIRQLEKDEAVPWKLLLDADPSEDLVSRYMETAETYIALLKEKVVGVYVLFPVDTGCLEIKNIAVENEFQRKGIGKLLLNDAMQRANRKAARTLLIGTSNASVMQLYLYQKQGFEITGIRYNFFVDNYPEPVFENGIQCKHLVMLAKQL